ncbi:hypothetical protein CSA56_12005 [candidate division KSB3 bacterium]|uniref:Uncharacterized protein n=1 Tax=candidate division KSB3 bacterium TaxID=2044937 RepID=A0A2G6KCH5_9BACT|nr:MAG: hypothetical protein CSA56_12005 [candidate division KSB3 bacterium]
MIDFLTLSSENSNHNLLSKGDRHRRNSKFDVFLMEIRSKAPVERFAFFCNLCTLKGLSDRQQHH